MNQPSTTCSLTPIPSQLYRKLLYVIALPVLALMTVTGAHAQSLNVLFTFDTEDVDQNPPLLNPGSPKFSGAIAQGRDGNLYSTTPGGGASSAGTVYVMTPSGTPAVLYSFTGLPPDGVDAASGLTLGTDGNLYGATVSGGTSNQGTIFMITPSGGTPKVLHNFAGSDGANPYAPPVEGRDGNFYGVTQQGGTFTGVAYRITPKGVFKVLSTVLVAPEAPLVLGVDGNFYGTTTGGGTHGLGTVFRMTSAGAVRTIYSFDQTNGAAPVGPLIQGSDGYLYGTASAGGDPAGDGVIFKITTTGKFTPLHPFNGADGSKPLGGLVQATDGNFYGVTSAGGAGSGTLYSISSAGSFNNLRDFDKPTTGTGPQLTLLQHTNGFIYGDTSDGGTTPGEGNEGPVGGQGTFYNIRPALTPFVSLVTSAAKVGTTIGILGQGLLGTTSVSFNGIPSTFTLGTDTYLTAAVPNGATKGTVTVVTSTATLTSNKAFIVLPNIVSFSPTSGKVGTSVVITGSGFTQASKVTFGGVKATTFTVTDSQVTATVPTGAKTGTIVVTTPVGTATSTGKFTVLP